MIFDLRTTFIALVLGLFIGATASWRVTSNYEEAKWTEATLKLKLDAGNLLQAETEKVLAAERKNTELNNQLEKDHALHKAEIDREHATNLRLTHELGGLRDPGRRPSCGGSEAGAQPATGASAGSTGSELSAEASEFLLEFAADADQAAEYAQACHSWAQGVAGMKK